MSKAVAAPATAGTFFLRLAFFLSALAFTIALARWFFTWPPISLWAYILIGCPLSMSPLAVTALAYDPITTFLPRPRKAIREWDRQQRQNLDRSAAVVCLTTLPLMALLIILQRFARKEAARDFVGGLIDWAFWFVLLSLALAALAGLIGLALGAHIRSKA